MKPPVVAYIEWVDSAIVSATWIEAKAARRRARKMAAAPMRSAGFLLDEGPDHVTLADSRNPTNGDVGMVFVIPRSAIRRLDRWAPLGQKP